MASVFIPLLHVPLEEGIAGIKDTDEVLQQLLDRGGEAVNKELVGLIWDMYELRKTFGAN